MPKSNEWFLTYSEIWIIFFLIVGSGWWFGKVLSIDLLRIIQRDMKRRIEQGVYEQDRDLWSKWHDYITDMIKTILNGWIKW